MSKKIEITIPLQGISQGKAAPSIEAFGYSGGTCKTATEAFERALGARLTEEVKPELYAQAEAVETLTQGG